MPLSASSSPEESPLIDAAVSQLAGMLPERWNATRSHRLAAAAGGVAEPRTLDAAIDVQIESGSFVTLVVEARQELAPRDVDQLFSGLAGTLRALASHLPVLVVAPWLSPRTQERLRHEDVNYLDLTGNALIKLDNPALFIRSVGATRNPQPSPARGRAGLRGPKAGRLVRLLADVRPPYALQEIAASTRLTPGYVSRLLDALDREALIERDSRGPVRSVDVPALLRRWAETYDVLRANSATAFVAPHGPADAVERLVGLTNAGRIAVTGSFAAVRRAPVAAPALLMAYCEEVQRVADALGLLPAAGGGNVALLSPFDPVAWDRAQLELGIPYVAVSQAAVDCLTGNGRMPAEGEALLDWMARDESAWRRGALDAMPGRA
ncbi:MAG TPA: helix-turn-helix domain-containing protein [Conexibacter sp.]|nr:helix-turn-helix domain-containing protein [Conexibacter sp.]